MSAVTTRRRQPWTLAELELLGEIPDSVFARRYRRSLKQVLAMREHRGIDRATAPQRWTAREIKLLGNPKIAKGVDEGSGTRITRLPHVRSGLLPMLRMMLRFVTANVTDKIARIPNVYAGCYGVTAKYPQTHPPGGE